jgi:hypothetical protein
VARPSRTLTGFLEPSRVRSGYPRWDAEGPRCGAFHSAPERTRTSTDHSVHKALNLNRPAEMGLPGFRGRKLGGFLDALDGLVRMDVATVLPRDSRASVTRDLRWTQGVVAVCPTVGIAWED